MTKYTEINPPFPHDSSIRQDPETGANMVCMPMHAPEFTQDENGMIIRSFIVPNKGYFVRGWFAGALSLLAASTAAVLVVNPSLAASALTRVAPTWPSTAPQTAEAQVPTSSPSANPTPVSTPTPTPSPTPSISAEAVCLRQISLPDKIDMSLVLGVYPSGKGSTTKNNLEAMSELSKKHLFGGLVVMTSFEDGALVRYKKELQFPQTMYVDQEGGDRKEGGVQRIPYDKNGPSTNESAHIASQAEVGKMSEKERAAFVKNVLTPMYSYLKLQGLDVTLGPVVDVADSTIKGSPLKNRTFGDDAKLVSEIAAMYVDVAKLIGLDVALKHFPNLGDAVTVDGGSGNTDQRKMTIEDWESVSEKGLAPYKAIVAQNGEVTIMVGTHTIPGLTGKLPAAVSPEAIQLLKEIAPSATIITDNLGTPTMLDKEKGMGWTASKSVVEALGVGVHRPMLLNPNTTEGWVKQLDGIYEAANEKLQQSPDFSKTLDETTIRNINTKGYQVCEVAGMLNSLDR